MSPKLAHAIDRFSRSRIGALTADPEDSAMRCGIASMVFARYLRSLGVDAWLVAMTGDNDQEHIVVLVDEVGHAGVFVDWTARQFDPRAEHPAFIDRWPTSRLMEEEEEDEFGIDLVEYDLEVDAA